MSQTWNYEVDLPGNMTHTMQVQSDSENVDFNLYVLDPAGNVVVKDDGPEAGAECSLTTEQAETYTLRIELVRGQAGFSINVASRSALPSGLPQGELHKSPVEAAPDADASATLPSQLTRNEIQDLVAAHNQWRAKYGVPALQWCEDLAAVAQAWADSLGDNGMQMQHRSPNQLGENLFWCAEKNSTGQEVVDAWGSEVEFYDEAANNWWPKAGHFSQVIWQDTTHVGGGVVRRDGQEIWVCNYNPRGNWTGQRPYTV